MNIGFDIISDLNLDPGEAFNWEGKATSLYCLVAGNISHDTKTIRQVLSHLARYYQGVFYVAGSLEYRDSHNIDRKTDELIKLTRTIKNVAFLHHNVVIIDGIALLGSNGWYGNMEPNELITDEMIEQHRHEDIVYLKSTLEKLQRHLDVRKVVIITNSVPSVDLYFREEPESLHAQLPLNLALIVDTEKKVSHWIYGSYGKVVDTNINDINYINNAHYKREPYWAKRIEVRG